MTARTLNHPTLLSTLCPSLTEGDYLRKALMVLGASALVTLAAKIQIPFYPVPLTLQTFIIAVLAMTLGWRLAGLTLVLYLVQGALGLPVFAGTPEKGLGLVYMAGPTGGYLFGFVLAAMTCGWLAERGWDRSHLLTLAAMSIGHLLIFIPGLIWLGLLLGWDKPILSWGLYPFIPGMILKIILGTVALRSAWVLSGKRPSLDLK